MDPANENPYQSPATPLEATPYEASPDFLAPRLAPRLSRLGAAIADSVIGALVSLPLMFLTGYWQRAMQQQVSVVEMGAYSVAGFAIYLLLHGYLLATRGQSIGKLLVRVRIVDYDAGEILPLPKLVGLRLLPVWLVSLIPIIGGFLALIDVLFIFGAERRCIHDLIAGTKVVEA